MDNTNMELLNEVINLSSGSNINYDVKKGMYSLFIDELQKHPEKEIIIDDFSNVHVSYKQLYNLICHMRMKLANNGVREGSVVGINLQRSYKVVVSVLALCKIGAVVVPLDKSYPKNYISYIIKDCHIENVISEDPNNEGKYFKYIYPVSFKDLNKDFFKIDKEKIFKNSLEQSEKLDDIRFIYYTSGSTGKPKGVFHTEKQILYEYYWRMTGLPIDRTDIIGQRSPINVVLSIVDMFHGLLCGIKTVILSDDVLTDPEKLLERIEFYKISWMVLPASIVSLISLIENEKAKKLNALKTIVTAGELLKEATFQDFCKKFPHIKIVDLYGCTEVLSMLYKNIVKKEDFSKGFKKVDNLNVYIFDENNDLVPIGKQGEICVSGIFTENFKYYSCESSDNKKFFDWRNPCTNKLERVYKTGDLGYLTKGGEYYILGRLDSSIKINARFVNLKGIEIVIGEMPEVKDVAVFPLNVSKYKSKVPVVAVVKNTDNLNKSDIIDFLKTKFPEYMIPKYFHFLGKLPKLPNGKVDYKTLEKIYAEQKFDNVSSNVFIEILERYIGYNISFDSFDTEFSSLGLDSITGTKFIFELSDKLGISISPAEIYNYPTVNKFLGYLNSLSLDYAKFESNSKVYKNNDIGIVGMSGIFPDAKDINKFWSNLCNGKNSVRMIPFERWEKVDENGLGCKYGGFLENIDLFDAEFFGLSGQEARSMSPHQRLCLRESYKALKDAKYDFEKDSKNVGVFIGASDSDCKEVLNNDISVDSNTVLGSENSIIAARISYFNDFLGPSLVVNTACSSSLVAVHLACQSLALRECDIALVGGVNIIQSLDFFKKTNAIGVFSSTGQCKTFDNDADGFVPGEGVGFLVLKRIEDVTTGEGAYAVIKGSSVNQDGKTNGITAPSGNSQALLQIRLYEKIGISPEDVSYIEAHGTGTKLGDVVELESLEKVFRRFSVPLEHKCEIGSVKTNIGHLIACSGMVGLIKAILCIHHRKLVPSLNFNIPNKLFDWENSHLKVTTKTTFWNKPNLMSAVSSYGIGGTNAFCILGESPHKRLRDIRCVDQYFTEKSYLGDSFKNCSIVDNDADQLIADSFSGYDIDENITLIENGIESLKLIDFKNHLLKRSIVISLEDLVNIKVKDLKNIISLKKIREVF